MRGILDWDGRGSGIRSKLVGIRLKWRSIRLQKRGIRSGELAEGHGDR